MKIKHLVAACAVSLAAVGNSWAEGFNHKGWDQLLKEHVASTDDGNSTQVDYAQFASKRDELKTYLDSLASVSQDEFDGWPKADQLAFLINAYNAWTIELILSAWPDLDSIRDLGSLFTSPWEKEFVPLLGETRSLDDIEHGLIRGSDRYQDPRIHFAVNCASIGCPALRAEAYLGEQLNDQLEAQTHAFLADASRNRLRADALELSSIFKWYREDFEKGWRDFYSLEQFLLQYGSSLQLTPKVTQKLEQEKMAIDFLKYDWQLNAKR
ncbi:DUF547 domain-containing protein [Halioxenophilus aromaticivorans]|uniref:DUF547 domain-containing protein n=1 Tax=Halioxenophilus aromaticivorans TaxID=1306992 RepID=A0AAV3U940_9ALTE